MEPERLPLLKVLDSPFLSLDGTSAEMAALLVLFLAVLGGRIRRQRERVGWGARCAKTERGSSG